MHLSTQLLLHHLTLKLACHLILFATCVCSLPFTAPVNQQICHGIPSQAKLLACSAGNCGTLMQVSAVAAVGIAEGVSHVNWGLLAKILLWWLAGFCLTMVATSALIAQGESIHLRKEKKRKEKKRKEKKRKEKKRKEKKRLRLSASI